ncbi:MAG TPA: hypothetical protein VFI31_13345 [Pirellulales bacterium]|nr:hypothetical protein [Pirellulales bacterium]
MRSFSFAVAVAALAFLTVSDAHAGGRRVRYYSYGTRPTVSTNQSSTAQSLPAQSSTAQTNAAQSNTIRRYSNAPSTQGTTTRSSYSPSNARRTPVMGYTPYGSSYGSSYWRADRKIKGY